MLTHSHERACRALHIDSTLAKMARLRQQDETILEGSQRTKFDFADFDHSAIPLEPIHYPVMIIGSSMIGMTLGTLLGYHGCVCSPWS